MQKYISCVRVEPTSQRLMVAEDGVHTEINGLPFGLHGLHKYYFSALRVKNISSFDGGSCDTQHKVTEGGDPSAKIIQNFKC